MCCYNIYFCSTIIFIYTGILKYYDFFNCDLNKYLVMEHGGTGFFEHISSTHKALKAQAQNHQIKYLKEKVNKGFRRWFIQMVKCIHYIHTMRVCHLDISLENMCLKDNTCIKFIDFGAAEYFKKWKCWKYCGKSAYMAPEVCILILYVCIVLFLYIK